MAHDHVVLLVTRVEDGRVRLLCAEDGRGSVQLPSVALGAGEHPAEGAWRALRDVTGLEEFRSFRKLGPGGGMGGCHLFVTSPAEPLPETLRSAAGEAYHWRDFGGAVAAVAAGGGEAWRLALPELVRE